MELFFVPESHIDLTKNRIELADQEFHHIVRVVRKKSGDTLWITDGRGTCFQTEIEQIGKNSAELKILSQEKKPAPKTKIAVALSLMKASERFDFFLEKATELGVAEILPMMTHRTVSRPAEKQYEKKHERWEKIVLAASKQSRQMWFPKLHPIQPFEEVLKRNDEVKLIAYENSAQHLVQGFSGKSILFLIGGEGGFTEAEVLAAKQAGFQEMTLGESVLRAETAGIFAVAMVRANLLSAAIREPEG
ncbi:protein of unknown function DUF558 [Chloroherpeton thalassium ATCC 35110]|uniref:Ribosomal RNA small subunit methyltransferase E n=1 Tax=Chloroherpeton thalassium (strain ATCC 35110 / GB-78) TaxID=517418 RepID=B3QSF9_CHLT3|nr:16S rRNA (uracil(1498)-N(3))-methyltransferase [Chloroherpeton thalassium]ACF12550.1 protein of unknown function DUF558 [Chloroherpeton thalassium ATCC 35110]